LLLLALINPYAAKADTVGGFAWSGTVGGIPVSGTALFIVQGSASPYNLEIILSETSTTTPTSADDALAGLDFTISGQGTTALVMSTAASGAAGMFTSSGNTTGNNTAGTNICATGSYNAGAPPAGCNVTGGWEAGYTGTGFTGDTNAHWGIGTTTYTGGAYIAGDVGLDNYGIDPTVGDGTGVGNYPFVDGTATFVLTGVVLANPTISNVAGVYGADVGVLAGSSIPEPGTVATFAGGFLLLALARRRRQTR
jgi:hypothetical protein